MNNDNNFVIIIGVFIGFFVFSFFILVANINSPRYLAMVPDQIEEINCKDNTFQLLIREEDKSTVWVDTSYKCEE